MTNTATYEIGEFHSCKENTNTKGSHQQGGNFDASGKACIQRAICISDGTFIETEASSGRNNHQVFPFLKKNSCNCNFLLTQNNARLHYYYYG